MRTVNERHSESVLSALHMALSTSTPTYFLAPHCDIPPDGLIALGSIIVNPKTPQKSLNSRSDQRVAIPADELQESFKDNWRDAIRSGRHHRVTLWTSFLQMILGIGADVSAGLTNGREDIYEFRRLETKYFEPDAAYIQKSLQKEGVQAYITATRHKKPVYMVTGVKIARGAAVRSKTMIEYGGMLRVGLDATSLTGVPISGGPQIEKSEMKERLVRFDSGSDYVFAYRVVKIHLRRDGSVKRLEDFNKGALFGVDEGDSTKEELDVGCWRVEELSAASEELQGNDTISKCYEDGQDVVTVTVKP